METCENWDATSISRVSGQCNKRHAARYFGDVDMRFTCMSFVCDRWTVSNSHYGFDFVN